MMKLRQTLEDLIATPLLFASKKWLITRFPIAQNAKKRYHQNINSFIQNYYSYTPIDARPEMN